MKNTRKIKSIRVKNFQQFIDKTFEFKDGVNVVVGDSGAGKSTLIRALYYNLHNKPKGAEKLFNRTEKSKMEVEVTDTEGNRVIHKHKTYIVNNLKPLKAFGNDTPSEVTDIFPLTDINWQRQHDGFFLLWNTPGNAAKQLNQVMGMEDQESILKYIKEQISEEKGELKRITKNLEEVDLSLNKLKSIKQFKFKINNLISLEDKLISQGEKKDRLKKLISEYKALQASDSRFLILKRIPEIDQIIKETDELSKQSEKIENLWEKVEELQQMTKKPKVNAQELLNFLNDLQAEYYVLNSAKDEYNKLNILVHSFREHKNMEGEILDEITTYESEYKNILSKFKFCPICNSKIQDGKS